MGNPSLNVWRGRRNQCGVDECEGCDYLRGSWVLRGSDVRDLQREDLEKRKKDILEFYLNTDENLWVINLRVGFLISFLYKNQ